MNKINKDECNTNEMPMTCRVERSPEEEIRYLKRELNDVYESRERMSQHLTDRDCKIDMLAELLGEKSIQRNNALNDVDYYRGLCNRYRDVCHNIIRKCENVLRDTEETGTNETAMFAKACLEVLDRVR
jgi:hypothetical protein